MPVNDTEYEFELALGTTARHTASLANRRALRCGLLAPPQLSSDVHEYSPPGTRSLLFQYFLTLCPMPYILRAILHCNVMRNNNDDNKKNKKIKVFSELGSHYSSSCAAGAVPCCPPPLKKNSTTVWLAVEELLVESYDRIINTTLIIGTLSGKKSST